MITCKMGLMRVKRTYTIADYDSLLERCIYMTSNASITDGITMLDVSDLQGEYYVYVLLTTPNALDVISIHGLYI